MLERWMGQFSFVKITRASRRFHKMLCILFSVYTTSSSATAPFSSPPSVSPPSAMRFRYVTGIPRAAIIRRT